MARLPALIDTLAELDTRSRQTIEHVARLVREAGYIQTTKRGRGAAEMTEADAAALLIGLNAIETPTDAAQQVPLFSELTIQKDASFSDDPVPVELKRVTRAKTFGEAVEALIVAAPTLERLKTSSRASFLHGQALGYSDIGITADSGFALEVCFYLPGPLASILVRWMNVNAQFSNEDPLFTNAVHHRYVPGDGKKRKRHEGRADRHVTVAFGIRTLAEIHRTLWPKGENSEK